MVRSFLLGRRSQLRSSPPCSDCVEVLFGERPTASLWIRRSFRDRVFRNYREETTSSRAARASSCILTGTAATSVAARSSDTMVSLFVEPVVLPSRRGERKSFWGASADRSAPRAQRREPRQRLKAFGPRKCVWRRLERTPMILNSSEAKPQHVASSDRLRQHDVQKNQDSSPVRGALS